MKTTITPASFFTKSFLLILLSIGSFHYSKAQTLHSATDSVMATSTTSYTDAGWGFRFSPTQNIYVQKLGKRVPSNGSYSWVIWDVATQTKVYQQHSQVNTPNQYVYEDLDNQTTIELEQGKEYILELYGIGTADYYYNNNSSQIGQHLIYYDMRFCNSCDTNTYPPYAWTNYHYGISDFLYSLTPPKSGMNNAAVLSVDSLAAFCSGNQNVYATIANYGINQIDSVDIHWEINGIPQPTVHYRQLLDTIDGSFPFKTSVLLGSAYFNPGNTTIRVYTSLPNGIPDTTIHHDTLTTILQTATPPTDLVFYNGTTTSMDFEVFGLAGTLNYEYGLDGFAQGTGTMGNSTTNSFTISSLLPSNSYDIYVRSNCNGTDTSAWVGPFGFCTDYMASLYNDMESEDLGAPPTCWNARITNRNASMEVATSAGTAAPYAGTKALYMNSSNSNPATDTLMAISPLLSDLTAADKQVRFYANSDDPDSKLIVGTMAHPNANVLNPIDTITFQVPDIYQEVIVTLDAANGYNGTDEYIYLKHSLGGASEYIRIDNFYYEPIPSCRKPSNLYIENSAPDSIDLGWTENNLASQWEIRYGTTGFDIDTGISVIASSNPYTLKGLKPNTVYDYYVRTICGSGDSSIWPNPITFETPCLLNTAPYFNDFEADPAYEEPICWFSVATAINSNVLVSPYNQSSGLFNGYQALHLYSNGTPGLDKVMAISPGFSDLTAGDKQIRFFTNSDAPPASKLIIGTISNPFDTSLSPLDTINFAVAEQYQEIVYELNASNGYNGTDQYIYLMHNLGVIGDNIRIDNFHYETTPSCPKPAHFSLEVDSLTATSIEFSWTERGNSTIWEIEYDTMDFTPGTGTRDTVSINPVHIKGLNPDTEYQIYVRSICGMGDSSYWSGPFKFETPCIPGIAPYYNNFETDPTFEEPICWSTIATMGGPFAQVRSYLISGPFTNDLPYAGSRGLYMYSSTATALNRHLISVSPGFSDLTVGDKQIRFFANTSDTISQLIIGTMPSPIDTANMHPLYSIKFAQPDVYEEIIFEITASNGYNGTDQYIYMEHSFGSTADFIRIDEFHYESIPSCKKPSDLSVSNIATSTADLSWFEKYVATEWQVQYGSSGFALGSGIDSITTTNPLTITGLDPATYYEFYVRSICGRNDTSFWTGPYEFVTDCPVSFDAPYFNDFENNPLNMNPTCWDSIGKVNFSWVEVKASEAYSGSQALHLYCLFGNTNSDTLMAISPRFAGLTAGNKRINFFGNSDYTATELIIGTLASPTSTVLNSIDTITFTTPDIYQEVEITFNASTGYNGTDEYIYLMHNLSGIASNIRIDEFNYFEVPPIDAGITDLIAPENDINKCFTSTENLNVELTAIGLDTLDFTLDTAVVTVNVTGAVTQTYNYTINDNSLNNGLPLAEKDTINIPMGTVDMSNPGVYYFDISLSMKNDGKVSNNTFKDTVRANLGGNIIGSDSLCLGDTLILSTESYVGSLQWQSSTGGAFTDIVGADSSEIKINPSSITSYRVLACGTGISDTLTVTPVSVSTPVAKDSTVVINCGDSAIVALTATSTNPNAFFEWYDVPSGGSPITVDSDIVGISPNGDTLYYEGFTSSILKSGVSDTFYVQEVILSSIGKCTSIRDTAIATIGCLVGIEETGNNFSNIAIHPNPSKGIFHIIGIQVKEQVEINIYSTSGKLVYQSSDKFSDNFDERIDISGFAKGLYFVKLQGKKSFEMRKVVIQ